MAEEFNIAKKMAEDARERWKLDVKNQRFHGLVISEKGGGKTTLAATMPAPVYIFSFDPNGLVSVRKQIEEGRVIPDTRYEVDSISEPRAYVEFEQNFNRMGQQKMFEKMGSVVIDTMTTLTRTAIWQIMKKEGRTPPGMTVKSDDAKHNMRIQDWGTALNLFIMLSRSLSTLPCHTLMLGHVGREKDEAMQTFVQTIALPGQASDQVPIHTPEVYLLKVTNSPKGLERKLLTQNDGEFKLASRLGANGVLGKEEPPNLQELIKKAGLPWEDKELL